MAVSRACPAMPPETRLQQRAWLPCAGHNVLSARRKSCRGWAVAHLLRRQPRRPRPLPGIAEAGGRLAAGNIKARSFFIVCLSAWPALRAWVIVCSARCCLPFVLAIILGLVFITSTSSERDNSSERTHTDMDMAWADGLSPTSFPRALLHLHPALHLLAVAGNRRVSVLAVVESSDFTTNSASAMT
ncbi:hypothetical protein DAI22_05g254800 [Oryza sativa Japonica Group]|nr:hypothetical protein DAI22_05g254800 [Oryza sativa Japonica Group]